MHTPMKFWNKLKILVLIYCQFVTEISYKSIFSSHLIWGFSMITERDRVY